jgi:DNA polymerase-4
MRTDQYRRFVSLLDMGGFYASVELLGWPEFQDKPVGIIHSPRAGVVIASNRVAKEYGVRSGMRVDDARYLCPELTLFSKEPYRYNKFSRWIEQLLRRNVHFVVRSPYGHIKEEWYLYWGRKVSNFDSLEIESERVRKLVEDWSRGWGYRGTYLPASIGSAWNKLLARLACDIAKKESSRNLVLRPEDLETMVYPRPVEDLCEIAKIRGRRLREMGIRNIGDLANAKEWQLERFLKRNSKGNWMRDTKLIEVYRDVLYPSWLPDLE